MRPGGPRADRHGGAPRPRRNRRRGPRAQDPGHAAHLHGPAGSTPDGARQALHTGHGRRTRRAPRAGSPAPAPCPRPVTLGPGRLCGRRRAFGGTAVWQHDRAREAQHQARDAERRTADLTAVLAAPDAKSRTARLAGGAGGTVVVSAGRDKAVFISSRMPKPPSGKVYQLWFDDAGTMRSAGLMDPHRTSEAVLLDGNLAKASGVGITVEPAGGSARPTSAPLALLHFPT
nr:anti-sigma factor [Streptomyces sp. RPA4-2]